MKSETFLGSRSVVKWSCMLILLASLFSATVAEQAPKENVRAERTRRYKELYKFEEWAGKVKEPGKSFGDLSKAEMTIVRTLPNYLRLEMSAGPDKPRLTVEVHRTESPLAAAEGLIGMLENFTFPPPVFKPSTDEGVGDVCFLPINLWHPEGFEEAVMPSMFFIRNNIIVDVDQMQEGKTSPWDLVEVARAIDSLFMVSLPLEDEPQENEAGNE